MIVPHMFMIICNSYTYTSPDGTYILHLFNLIYCSKKVIIIIGSIYNVLAWLVATHLVLLYK